ncbi:hypothetical protein [Paenibacillus sp. Marseille-Q4541]|uniref:hypothetical protein n=1 Tax=Paenibacillus sp. Marseille-Q4541 TaxID=2831522 RepID=UPI001BA6C44E|nr:hypothetical protein [Paenibacillus sp. Marseille-Q4541]
MKQTKNKKNVLTFEKENNELEVPIKATGSLNWVGSFHLFKVYRKVKPTRMIAPTLIILYFIFAQIIIMFFSILVSTSFLPAFLVGFALWALLNKYLIWVLKETTVRTMIKEGYTPLEKEDKQYVDALYL